MILIIGLPNAGKTTYSQQFDNVIHLDDFPRNKFLNCNAVIRKTDGNVVVEGIYNTRCRRELLLKQIRRKKCKRICIWIDTPLEVCLERCDKNRPKDVVLNSSIWFQPPSLDEGWDEIIKVSKY